MNFEQFIFNIYYNLDGFALVFILSILLHELGHMMYFKYKLKKYVELRFYFNGRKSIGLEVGYPNNYIHLTPKQKTGVYLSGIVLGMIPFLIGGLFNQTIPLLTIIYFYGCKTDLKNIWRCYKSEQAQSS